MSTKQEPSRRNCKRMKGTTMNFDEQEAVFKKLERDTIERRLADPFMQHVLHAVTTHDELLAALKDLVELAESVRPFKQALGVTESLARARAIIAKAEVKVRDVQPWRELR